MLIALSRTLKAGFQNFYRNGSLSFAATTILALTLLIISFLMFLSVALNFVTRSIQDKVDITVFFNSDVAPEKIHEFEKEVSSYREVKSVEYVSKEQALSDFKAKNADNQVIIQSIEALGENPLQASVNIKAKDPEKFEVIARSIENSVWKESISRINYAKNKIVIERVNSFLRIVRRVGLLLAIIFSAIAILITFNAIRITIYTHREEIEIMRLVGASNAYIRMPFIFEGVFYGAIASLIIMLLMIPVIKISIPWVAGGAVSVNEIQNYFWGYAWLIFLAQFVLGVSLGIISSLIAIRKYLKI